MARPEHQPTEGTRESVKALMGFGVRQDEIAAYIGIDEKTLRKHYRRELDTAQTEANAKVAQSLFNQAIDGNIAAAIFWMKVRAGWTEKNAVDVTSAGEKIGYGTLSDAEIDRRIAALERGETP